MTKLMTMDRDDLYFPAGTIIKGKWHGRLYRLVRLLGSGAQGTVYLARDGNREVAVKMAKDRASLISEVHILKQFDKYQGENPGPSLYDSDDWLTGGRVIGFCAMEFLPGRPLNKVLVSRPFDWTAVCLVQLLQHLQTLHDHGIIFGDLKPENLMLMDSASRVRCLDFGGATREGRSVREYTEFYDRGYWGFGTRKADPGYDLFACGMIMIYASCGRRFEKSAHPGEQLLEVVASRSRLAPYRQVLIRALTGRYTSAKQMRGDLIRKIMEKQNGFSPEPAGKRRKSGRRGEWLGAWLSAAFMVTLYIICVCLYVM